MQVTYKEMEDKLRNKESFNGNSVVAEYEDGMYKVWSYGTEILRTNGFDFNFDNSYYSVTTSKIQNMLIDVFGLNNNVRKRD